MRTDGRTDVTKLTVAFRNFANAPKNISLKRITFKLSNFIIIIIIITSKRLVFITFSVTAVVVFVASSFDNIKGKFIPVTAMMTQVHVGVEV